MGIQQTTPVVGANVWHDTPQSSNVRSFYYDEERRILFVVYGKPTGESTPRKYAYANVPPEVFAGLLAAPSKGQYAHAHIKNSFGYQPL